MGRLVCQTFPYFWINQQKNFRIFGYFIEKNFRNPKKTSIFALAIKDISNDGKNIQAKTL